MPNLLKGRGKKGLEATSSKQVVYVADSLFSLLKVIRILKTINYVFKYVHSYLHRTDEDVEMEIYAGKFQKHYC